jgi:RNA polymerase sigma-70 factor (ECF subfamily)
MAATGSETRSIERVIEVPDEILMRRAQAGDVEAFERLYARYAVRALTVARSVCGDSSLAEDAVQEAFLAMWTRRASYRADRASFAAWSMTITRNRAIDWVRRDAARLRRDLTAELDAGADARDGTQEAVLARSEQAALFGSLRALPRPQAEVIALAYFGGLTLAEIAGRLGVPEGTVKGRMRLGLRRLRRRYGPVPSPSPSTA